MTQSKGVSASSRTANVAKLASEPSGSRASFKPTTCGYRRTLKTLAMNRSGNDEGDERLTFPRRGGA